MLSVAVQLSCVKIVLQFLCVDEIKNTQIDEFITVERNEILDNIVNVLGCNIPLEISCKFILSDIRHCLSV